MFDLFNIKKLKMKKQELEQEIVQLRQYVVDVNEKNKILTNKLALSESQIQSMLINISLIEDQLRMSNLKLQGNKYSDDSRFY
jgi:predicted  nucleic acid-binding Zn-ribbon protein